MKLHRCVSFSSTFFSVTQTGWAPLKLEVQILLENHTLNFEKFLVVICRSIIQFGCSIFSFCRNFLFLWWCFLFCHWWQAHSWLLTDIFHDSCFKLLWVILTSSILGSAPCIINHSFWDLLALDVTSASRWKLGHLEHHVLTCWILCKLLFWWLLILLCGRGC